MTKIRGFFCVDKLILFQNLNNVKVQFKSIRTRQLSVNLSWLFFIFFQTIIQYTAYSQEVEIRSIIISGNLKTEEKVISRELTFEKNQKYSKKEINTNILSSKSNLINTRLFKSVEIFFVSDTITNNITNISTELIDVYIVVQERLNIGGSIIFDFEDRNFNDWLEHKSLEKLMYGGQITHRNLWGKRKTLTLDFVTGFNQQFGVDFYVPFIDKRNNTGLGLAFNFFNNENQHVLTENNKQLWLKLDDITALKGYNFDLQLTNRQGIHNTLKIFMKYNSLFLSDTLLKINPNFILPQHKNFQYFTLGFEYKIDHRDFKAYPLEGYYFDIKTTKNTTFLLHEEDISTLTINSNFRKFNKLKERVYFAAGLNTRIRLDQNESWFFNRALGFRNDYVRGYENYVIDGQNFIIVKSNFKYGLFENYFKYWNPITFRKNEFMNYRFYLNFFTDIGYVSEKFYQLDNTLSNKLLFGYGLGIDLITLYDRVLRFEFSRNREKEFTYSIHFTAPI